AELRPAPEEGETPDVFLVVADAGLLEWTRRTRLTARGRAVLVASPTASIDEVFDAGADDVLPLPAPDAVLLASARSTTASYERFSDTLAQLGTLGTLSLDSPDLIRDVLARCAQAVG